MKEKAFQLLEKETYCVISTVSPDIKSESALVGFSVNEKLEIMIGTSKKSRKFKNILSNHNVSIVFGPLDDKAIQYEGIARPLAGGELVERKKNHFQRNPGARKYENDPEQTYILVEPKWMRLVQSGPFVLGEETRFGS